MWYSGGTVLVTNGQRLIAGTDTDFVSNVVVGQGFIGPDNRTYEIEQVISATQLLLRAPYLGGTTGGASYSIIPTQSLMKDLADQAAQLIASFAAVRDGVGQGLFGDGTVALPGLRFAGDQDTGIARIGDNTLSFVTGGINRGSFNAAGLFTAAGRTRLANEVAPSAPNSADILASALCSFSGAGGNYLTMGQYASGDPSPFSQWIQSSFSNPSQSTYSILLNPLGGAVGVGTNLARAAFHNGGARTALGKDSGGNHWLRTGDDVSEPNCLAYGFASDGGSITAHRWNVGGALALSLDGASLRTGTDNSRSLGDAATRFSVLYAASGSINTSDVRTKQQVSVIPEDWLDAWGSVRHVRFKFNDAVSEKGDHARWHVGYVAQEIGDAFAAHGLDATAIGLLCHDEWDEVTEPEYKYVVRSVKQPRLETSTRLFDENGQPASYVVYDDVDVTERVPTGQMIVTREAGDRWSIRPDECAAIEAAYQRREIVRQAQAIATMSAQIAALEAAS